MQEFWNLLIQNKDMLTWLGGGVVVIAGGLWTIIKYFFPVEAKRKSQASTTTLSGTGIILSGRDNVISAPVQIGLDETRAGRAVTEAVEPLSEQIAMLAATVSREKGVPITDLQVILQKVGGVEVSEQDVPRVLKLLEKMGDELLNFRAQFSRQIADRQFIDQLHSSPNVETLLYNWMSHASDRHDEKLREKMAEWTLQSELESNIEEAPVKTYNRYVGATAQTGKSSEVSAQEVQTLVKQWKTITDMTSNLSKDINDMAMTSVRKLR